jgi:hypothetical protein
MAETSKIWYYIDGEDDVTSVPVSLNETIDDLKKKIRAASLDSVKGCDAAKLILTRVRFITVSMNTGVTNSLCLPIAPAGR